MGKFSGVLIASDYDNTMVYTEGALKSGGPLPSVSQENREAVEYFMAEAAPSPWPRAGRCRPFHGFGRAFP